MRSAKDQQSDEGVTLVELLVAMFISVVVLAGVGTLLVRVRDNEVGFTQRTTQWNAMNAASDMLDADVRDAQVIREADDSHLVMLVVRNDHCALREWKIDHDTGKLTLQTSVFEQVKCSGPTGRTVVTNLVDRVDGAARFDYYAANSWHIPNAVQDGKNVKIVQWTFAAAPYKDRSNALALTFTTSAPANATGNDPGQNTTVLHGTAPILTVVTDPAGKEQPALQWTDTSPTVTASWVVWRTSAPEGVTTGAGVEGTTPVAWPTATTTGWVDVNLATGYTAVYSVQAKLTDGTFGPVSNVVVTGIRPAQVTAVTATGKTTSIDVTWTAAVGATGYDIYRDNTLAGHVTGAGTLAWTDGPGKDGWTGTGYGHTHQYRVVATNRWENLLTTHVQETQLPTGVTADTQFAGGLRLLSADSATAGAFTAAAAPTITVTPNADWSNTITWTPAGWTGNGPTTKGGVHRDRGWTLTTNGSTTATANTTWAPEWGGAETARTTTSRVVTYTQGQVAGQYRTYRAQTCNTSGCSPDGTQVTGLQRPPTPSCSAASSSTRSATVTVSREQIPSGYQASEVTGGVKADGAGAITGTGQQGDPTFNVDGLKHATVHTFTARNQNASPAGSGWSDSTTCQTTTHTLSVTITGWSSSTRTITATAAAGEGSSQNITLEGVATLGGMSGTWDPLTDGTGFTVTARNSDGVNDVAAQTAVATQTLAAPGAPSCSVAVTTSQSPGAVKVSGGDQVKLGSGGSVYSSPRSYSGLGAGTYNGYARSINSDGYNTAYSGWAGCGSGTITAPPAVIGSGLGGATDNECVSWVSAGNVRNGMYDSAAAALAAKVGSLYHMDSSLPGASEYKKLNGSGTNVSCSYAYKYPYYNDSGTHVGDVWGSVVRTASGSIAN